MHTEALNEQLREPDGLNDVVLVDLDADTVTTTSTEEVPRLPRQAAEDLHSAVHLILNPHLENVDDPFHDCDGDAAGAGGGDDATRYRDGVGELAPRGARVCLASVVSMQV